MTKNNVNDLKKFTSKKSLSKNNFLIDKSDLRRKYAKLNKA